MDQGKQAASLQAKPLGGTLVESLVAGHLAPWPLLVLLVPRLRRLGQPPARHGQDPQAEVVEPRRARHLLSQGLTYYPQTLSRHPYLPKQETRSVHVVQGVLWGYQVLQHGVRQRRHGEKHGEQLCPASAQRPSRLLALKPC